jgi:enoyl-[acyl-carrier protein] reductase III
MSNNTDDISNEWGLILGSSSGFGAASAIELAKCGMNIFGVHFDRKPTLPNAEATMQAIRDTGREVGFFNVNAADPENRAMVLDRVRDRLSGEGKKVRVLLHSLAFGSVRPFIGASEAERTTKSQMEMTLDVMANSLVYWTQDMVSRDLLGHGGRIIVMTSAGGARVWPYYGAVSAAKAAIESHVRQLSVEMAKMGVTCNALRAGVTDTPALRKIPDHEVMTQFARARNPMGRLTEPLDVANAVVLLASPRSQWITGNVIGVDGAEFIVDCGTL